MGLGQFYELASTPGTRVGRNVEQSRWAFLDEPAVREKLLDFADEQRARVTFHLPAIHCVACVWLLENLFRFRAGVGGSSVNFARREVTIAFERAQVKLSEIGALLASLGYEPALTLGELDGAKARKAAPWRQRQWLQVGIAGFGFGNIMLLALPGYLGLDSLSGPWFKALSGWLSLTLALPVLIYSAADYWRAAWLSFRRRILTLDVPIALGLAAIYGQSVFEITSGSGEGYCDSLTGLIFFLLCGRVFQRKTFDRLAFDRDYKGFFPLAVTRKVVAQVSKPAVSPASSRQRVETPEADRIAIASQVENLRRGRLEICAPEESVSISQLAVGDRLLIRHGELVPADALLVGGDALVDYSFVTGESEPVTRRAGELLYAGGRQTGGAIEVETVKPVSESYLTSLWNNEAFRKHHDDDLDSQTNRYSRRFTVVVMGVAVAAAAVWLFVDASVALKAFTSVLIVACPCALALAAPLTLGTAQRALAERKAFLRNAQVVERMAGIDTVVFDKTGTLTTGTGAVRWQGASLDSSESRWLRSLSTHSTHPLAARIVRELAQSGFTDPVLAFVETPGCGVEGRVGGRDILMGSAAWLDSRGARGAALTPLRHPDLWTHLANTGASDMGPPKRPEGRAPVASASTVHVAIDGRYRGCFVFETTLRPEVESLAAALRGRYQLILLSGDQGREAERFRSLLGEGARVEFNQSPFDKLEAIRHLQAAGHKVMMVGDGLNDAGALQQADVGVAVVENVGTFSPASDVILEAAQLSRLAEALAFSRLAARVVQAGFVVSGLYNVVGISIAAAGLLSPLVCAVLMPLSSATVVMFAVGMTRWAAKRSFDCRSRREKALNSSTDKTSLLASAPVMEGSLP
jgi:Cu+-exporting ATPase